MSQVREINGERFYVQDDGTIAPSVTTVLGIIRQPFLEEWRGRVGNANAERIVREACDIGDAVHAALEQVNHRREEISLSGNDSGVARTNGARDAGGDEGACSSTPSYSGSDGEGSSETVRACVASYTNWLESTLCVVTHSEQPLFSLEYGYAGTADAIARIGSTPILMDYKTGGAHDETWVLQMSAYRQAILEQEGIDLSHAMILQFDKKTGDITTHTFDEQRLDEAFVGFQHALHLWKYLRGYS